MRSVFSRLSPRSLAVLGAGLVVTAVGAGARSLEVGGASLSKSVSNAGKALTNYNKKIQRFNLGPQASATAPKPKPLSWIGTADLITVIVIILAVVVFVVVPALRRVEWSRMRIEPVIVESEEPTPVPHAEVLAAIGRDLSVIEHQLDDADPRQAVINCWVSLEGAVAKVARARDRAETSAELATRVLKEASVDSTPLDGLHRLFVAARFSPGLVGEDERAAARTFLDALARSFERTDMEPVGAGAGVT